MDEHAIRMEMGAILDELATLDSDHFAERAALLARQHELRDLLQQFQVEHASEILHRWSSQAASKTPDDESVPVIVSPTEGAGGAV